MDRNSCTFFVLLEKMHKFAYRQGARIYPHGTWFNRQLGCDIRQIHTKFAQLVDLANYNRQFALVYLHLSSDNIHSYSLNHQFMLDIPH